MKIKQVLYKDIPRGVYKRGWSFTIPGDTKYIYFKLDKDLKNVELWELLGKIKGFPNGIVYIGNLGQFNYFRVQYFPEEITEEDLLAYINKDVTAVLTQ